MMRVLLPLMALLFILVQGCAPKDLPKKSTNTGDADAVNSNTYNDQDHNDQGYDINNRPQVISEGEVELQQTNQECYKADEFICEIEFYILEQTNEYRAQRGMSPVNNSPILAFASRDWSASQASRGFIGHAGFPSRRMSVVSQEFGSTQGVSMSGENVAYSGVNATDAESIARVFSKMWWNSSGHRRNMLGNHGTLGVGVYKKGGSTYYATQIFGR